MELLVFAAMIISCFVQHGKHANRLDVFHDKWRIGLDKTHFWTNRNRKSLNPYVFFRCKCVHKFDFSWLIKQCDFIAFCRMESHGSYQPKRSVIHPMLNRTREQHSPLAQKACNFHENVNFYMVSSENIEWIWSIFEHGNLDFDLEILR